MSFYLDSTRERYAEANTIIMKKPGDALALYKEGLGNMSKALEISTECKKKNIKLTGMRIKTRDIMLEGRDTYTKIKAQLKPEKVFEVVKEIAAMAKLQLDLFLNLE